MIDPEQPLPCLKVDSEEGIESGHDNQSPIEEGFDSRLLDEVPELKKVYVEKKTLQNKERSLKDKECHLNEESECLKKLEDDLELIWDKLQMENSEIDEKIQRLASDKQVLAFRIDRLAEAERKLNKLKASVKKDDGKEKKDINYENKANIETSNDVARGSRKRTFNACSPSGDDERSKMPHWTSTKKLNSNFTFNDSHTSSQVASQNPDKHSHNISSSSFVGGVKHDEQSLQTQSIHPPTFNPEQRNRGFSQRRQRVSNRHRRPHHRGGGYGRSFRSSKFHSMANSVGNNFSERIPGRHAFQRHHRNQFNESAHTKTGTFLHPPSIPHQHPNSFVDYVGDDRRFLQDQREMLNRHQHQEYPVSLMDHNEPGNMIQRLGTIPFQPNPIGGMSGVGAFPNEGQRYPNHHQSFQMPPLNNHSENVQNEYFRRFMFELNSQQPRNQRVPQLEYFPNPPLNSFQMPPMNMDPRTIPPNQFPQQLMRFPEVSSAIPPSDLMHQHPRNRWNSKQSERSASGRSFHRRSTSRYIRGRF